ncbi:hypothetical protein BDZ90DRAFT_245485 [Jaminaea rosea]|uniref:L-lactate dehydrogenase (cytochrome) n=1 Tax=Jaminaea rosea TaxID=1569628 RepID=A0A316UXS6_9BASI|nr:hypothetical protein BDZ90DRAFT_245485 [Jaminaea rosea]PWN28703.1 hypothetical protein BDZ90DRAFT_245485 [Jaminaea rosea]
MAKTDEQQQEQQELVVYRPPHRSINTISNSSSSENNNKACAAHLCSSSWPLRATDGSVALSSFSGPITLSITNFLSQHPGGAKVILNNAGKDVTSLYTPIHPSDAIAKNLTEEQHVGRLDPATVVQEAKEETDQERRRRIALENLPPVGSMLNLDDFERMAKEILSEQGWAYYSSAGDDCVTLRANRTSFSRVWFRPRVLRGASGKPGIDTSTTLLENSARIESSLPIYISPAAMAKLGHPEGEVNLTKAARSAGIVQGVSANASVSLDEIVAARETREQPLIYQLYINKDRRASEEILRKVEQDGFKAVMLTVDAPVMGKRELDMRAKGEIVSSPASPDSGGSASTSTSGRGVAGAISGYIDPTISWADIDWYRRHCKLPLILKGVQSVEDVQLAVQHGIEAVILSNHGGRSLDYSPPPLDVLISLRQHAPHLFNQIEVWLDGGVRRGTDVIKALCLGASAVGLGRPFLYAQSGFGQPGAERAVEIMRDEIERCMRFLGVGSLSELGPELVEVLPRVFTNEPSLRLSIASHRITTSHHQHQTRATHYPFCPHL